MVHLRPDIAAALEKASQLLDYGCLIFTSFYLPAELMGTEGTGGGSTSVTSSPLWLYFASREARAVFYTGMAIYLSSQSSRWGQQSLWYSGGTISLLLLSAVGTCHTLWLPLIPSRWISTRYTSPHPPASSPSWWHLLSSDSSGLFGTWWIGAGNGTWFGFIGRSSDHQKIVPGCFFDHGVEKDDKVDDLDQTEEGTLEKDGESISEPVNADSDSDTHSS